MATTTTASPDITTLDFSVLLDMSLAQPTIKITNLSTVITAANLQWVFEVISPSGTPIHVGDFAAPDINGTAFTEFILDEPLPSKFGQLEFDAVNKYSVKVYVKDSGSNIWSQTIAASICKPNGNNGKNNFGAASLDVKAKCNIGKIYVADQTNLLYKSLSGTKVSTVVTLTYPKDADGNQPAPFTTNQTPFLVDIINGGAGYSLYAAHVYDYEIVAGFTVRVRYSFNNPNFPVWCNVDLCPLFCEYDKLVALVAANCDIESSKADQKKLDLINAKLIKCFAGILEPLCDFDVPAVIDEIKEIGGFKCDCCRPMGLSNIGAVQGPDFTLAVNKIGGDMTLSWSNDGAGNFTLNYQDFSYNFKICDNSPSDAFTVEPTTSGFVKEFCLNVNLATLADELLTVIQNNPNLVTFINSIINQQTPTCNLNYQGLFPGTCNYTVSFSASVLTDTIRYIVIDGTTFFAPTGLTVNDASGIQAWLNSLSLGTFTSINGSGVTSISTNANSHVVSSITIESVANGVGRPRLFSNECGNICSILQLIINYLKDLSLLQIVTGGKINVCSIQADGSVITTPFLETANAYVVMNAIASAVCNLSSYISSRSLTAFNLKEIFAEYTSVTGIPRDGDYFFMSRAGALTKIPLVEAAKSIFTLLSNNSSVKDVYCAGALCSTVNNCSSVTNLAIAPGDTTAEATWDAVAYAIGYKWSLDGVNYQQVTGTAKTLTGLTVGTTYTLRVRPVYNNGDGTPCEVTLSFDTTSAGAGCAAPGGFTIDNIMDNSARLSWDAVATASGYQYRVNGGSWITIGNVLTVGIATTSNTDYNVSVRAIIGGTPCTDEAADTFTSANSVVIVSNVMSGAAVAFVISKFSVDALNLYGGAPIESGDTQNLTIPTITSSHTYSFTVISDVPATDQSVTINHKRGASVLHTRVLTAAGTGAATDLAFSSPFIAQAGDVFEVVTVS